MNRHSLRLAPIFILSFFIFFSCNKKNDLNPYPDNNRLLNFTKTITTTPPLGGTPVITNENYRFVYDGNNRVSQIVFTSNDPLRSNTISYMKYAHDTIYDAIKLVNGNLVELDTLITDTKGNINITHIAGIETNYQFYGKLLSRIDYFNGVHEEFTSYNGNFIKAISSLGDAYNSNYTYYTDQVNRIGDYFQLNSVCRYGLNFYKNNSLIRTAQTPTSLVNASYVIDGDSKITKTTATIVDANPRTEVYELQYEHVN